jgi:hypothetical protein
MAEEAHSTEEWRDVVGWEGLYQVSSFGRVRSLDRTVQHLNRWGAVSGRVCRGRVLKPSKFCGRYWQVSLKSDGERRAAYVHILVCEAFKGPRPSAKHQVAHGDGDGLNNRVSNLRWASISENNMDKVGHGTSNRGAQHPLSRLTAEVVRELRALGDPSRDKEVSRMFDVAATTVRHARLGHSWKWIS